MKPYTVEVTVWSHDDPNLATLGPEDMPRSSEPQFHQRVAEFDTYPEAVAHVELLSRRRRADLQPTAKRTA